MEIFMSQPGNLISTERLLNKVWGYDTDVEINVVWVAISSLRKKLQNLKADSEIEAVRGLGYTLKKIT
jgi:DNA-binding response OmpR family regulator